MNVAERENFLKEIFEGVRKEITINVTYSRIYVGPTITHVKIQRGSQHLDVYFGSRYGEDIYLRAQFNDEDVQYIDNVSKADLWMYIRDFEHIVTK
jgi:hypothetical protein